MSIFPTTLNCIINVDKSESASRGFNLVKRIDEADAVTNSFGMTFVPVQPGLVDISKGYKVGVSTSYYIQTEPVTLSQWNGLMGEIELNPIFTYEWGRNDPVVFVSWENVQEFIKRLNKKEGENKYRLPSEAEWIQACRTEKLKAARNGLWELCQDKVLDSNFPKGHFNDLIRDEGGVMAVVHGQCFKQHDGTFQKMGRGIINRGIKEGNTGFRLVMLKTYEKSGAVRETGGKDARVESDYLREDGLKEEIRTKKRIIIKKNDDGVIYIGN